MWRDKISEKPHSIRLLRWFNFIQSGSRKNNRKAFEGASMEPTIWFQVIMWVMTWVETNLYGFQHNKFDDRSRDITLRVDSLKTPAFSGLACCAMDAAALFTEPKPNCTETDCTPIIEKSYALVLVLLAKYFTMLICSAAIKNRSATRLKF